MPERKHSPKITTLRKKQQITIGAETMTAAMRLRRRSSYSGCPTMKRIGDDEEDDKHNASSSSSSRNDATKNAKLTTSATVPTNNTSTMSPMTSISPTNLHRCLPSMPLRISSPKLLL